MFFFVPSPPLPPVQTFFDGFAKLLPPKRAGQVFGNIRSLRDRNRDVLKEFQRCAKTQEPVGDVFVRLASLFEDEYGPYAANIVNAINAERETP